MVIFDKITENVVIEWEDTEKLCISVIKSVFSCISTFVTKQSYHFYTKFYTKFILNYMKLNPVLY